MPLRRAASAVLCPLALVAGAPAATAATWTWPARGQLLERFHAGRDPFVRGQHRGIDIAVAPGTPVRSACSGRVSFTGWAGTAGRTVSVRCGALTATYLHLRRIAVRRGRRLGAGERVGEAGTSGRPSSPTPHLHLGARWTARRRAYVDPLTLLGDGPPGARVPPLVPALRRMPRPLGPAPPRQPATPEPVAARPRVLASPAATAAPAIGWTVAAGLGLLALAAPAHLLRRRRVRRVRPAARRATAAVARDPRPG